MLFLQGLWHSVRVVGASLYWLLTIGLHWAGFAQLVEAPVWGWFCLILATVASAACFLVSPRFMPRPAGYVLATAIYLVALTIAYAVVNPLPH